MAFNIQAAKQAGYSDQEIQDYLKAQSQYKPNLLNNILSTGGAMAGGALGGAGGAMIPGADLTGIPEAAGAVAGAGIGSGAGNAAADAIRGLFGDKTVNTQQTLNDTPEQMKEGAIGQAIGVPIAKGLGFLAHPIAPAIGKVDSILAKSPKQIDISDLLGQYRSNVLPEMEKKGLGSDALQAFNKLSADMTGATSAFKANPNIMDTSGLGMNLPISQANQLKRNVTQSISNFYGQSSQNADINARKAFGSLLKKAVETAEPSVSKYNKYASSAYKAPDIAQGLSQIIGFGNPQAAHVVRMIGGLPVGAIQGAIPGNGGYLNKAIPALMQMLFQSNQNQSDQ